MVLTKRFNCNDGGIYYVREVAGNVFWFGEHPGGSFANVFLGTRTGNQVVGKWYDVPKGTTGGTGNITFTVSADENTLTRTSVTGGFGGSLWTVLPAGTILPSSSFKTAGFEANGNEDLDGTWMCNDGATYYVRQIGNVVAWFGERGAFSNVFVGTRTENEITGLWADVPKRNASNAGTLSLKVIFSATINRNSETGGFSGSVWQRVNALNTHINLNRLTIKATEDHFGDEPFLWSMFLKIDGDNVNQSTLENTVIGVSSTSGSHRNLTTEENIDAVRVLSIPPHVGSFNTILKTIRTIFDPTSIPFVRDNTVLAFIMMAWDQDGTSDGAIEAGRNAAVNTIQTEVTKAVRAMIKPDPDTIKGVVEKAVRDAISSATPWWNIPGVFDPDDPLGVQVQLFTFTQLVAAKGSSIPITLNFNGDGAQYVVTGSISVS